MTSQGDEQAETLPQSVNEPLNSSVATTAADVAVDYALYQYANNSQSSSSRRQTRKRQRGHMALSITTGPNLPVAKSFETSASDLSARSSPTSASWIWKGSDESPDTAHLSSLIAALILTSLLGVLAGLDAKHECLKHETNALMALMMDDDEMDDAFGMDDAVYEDAYDQAYLREAQNGCIRIFRRVMLPAMLVTTSMGFLGLLVLRCPSKFGISGSPQESFNLSLRLLAVVLVIFAAQTYNVVYIMLSPRMIESDASDSENPFHSLAAVDVLGHVSDNANLYYLTWISECVTLALCYQTMTATIRAHRAVQVFRRNSNLLPTTSWYILSANQDEESRHAWYQSVYRLRIRGGIWIAAFAACLIITASAQFVWKEVLWPYVIMDFVQEAVDDAVDDGVDDDGAAFEESRSSALDYMESLRGLHFSVCQSVVVNSEGDIPVAMCRRTAMAWLAGVLGMILCAFAIGTHWVGRTTAHPGNTTPHGSQTNVFQRLLENRRVPLGVEMVLSIIVLSLLGYNAIFTTSIQGPANNVGNLYYASWLAFLMAIRICLGCLEEWYEVERGTDTGLMQDRTSVAKGSTTKSYQAPSLMRDQAEPNTKDTAPPPTENLSEISEATNQSSTSLVDQFEKDRVNRLRTYFCLSIFSTVCSASAHDAAQNEEEPLNAVQRYIILAPIIVASISMTLFVLCLSRRCYLIASHFCVGGLLSVVCFGLWLADLVLTMHSEESWAVNRIGEIKMANLYYFSWASILTAGLQLMSFANAILGMSKKDTMSIVWIGICKVCFVIFGAGMHIWLNISDKCDINDLTSGAVTFCSRTVLALTVSLTGMLVGGIVVLIRFVQKLSNSCHCDRVQAHIEIILSSFLLLLFAAAVALITGIGGPGQSVGDLYYSTWLAFGVSLGIFLHCYDQITKADNESRMAQRAELNDVQVSDRELV